LNTEPEYPRHVEETSLTRNDPLRYSRPDPSLYRMSPTLLPGEPSSLRVGILTDDALYGEGLVRILSSQPSIRVTPPRDGASSVAAVLAENLHVLLVDSRVDRHLRFCTDVAAITGPATILVAATVTDERVCEALSAGARGLLAQTAGPQDLLKAIRVVAAGEIWASRHAIAACLHRAVRATRTLRSLEVVLEEPLSHRERDVFRQAATGLGNKEIAGRLSISEATVKVHLTHIFQKLGLQGRGQLAAAAHGLLPAPVPKLAPTPLRRPA
jgi:DNA-binding NarL/FixJ family response regulator